MHGERELRIYHLPAWRESNLFIPRERAALAWTEVLIKLSEQGVSDDIYDGVRIQLSEKELSDLTFLVMSINAWNRLNIGFKTVAVLRTTRSDWVRQIWNNSSGASGKADRCVGFPGVFISFIGPKYGARK